MRISDSMPVRSSAQRASGECACHDAGEREGEREREMREEPIAGTKKRVRGSEPPTSALMGHDAVQALLDAWEA